MKSIQSNIKKAKQYLDKNDCVAVPTETVYGLAGNAYSDISVKRIFKLKKRPTNNPLIVHYSDIDKLKNDCVINDNFVKLYNKFSPGPITFILKLKKISKISKLSNSRKIVKSKAVTIRKAEVVADQLENAAKKTKNEKKRRKLAFAASMIKRKVQETRAAMQNVDDYARTSADLKGSTLKTLSQRSANPARSAKARFLGTLYRGSHGEKLGDLKRQVKIPETLNFDFLAAATKKASQKRGEWVKFRAPDGTGVRSSNRATGTGGASFSKSLETSEDFASGAYTRGTGTPKFEMMVVTSGKKADNIDFVAHYEKTGSPQGGLPSNIRKEKEVVMLGDNIPVDQIWIKVN